MSADSLQLVKALASNTPEEWPHFLQARLSSGSFSASAQASEHDQPLEARVSMEVSKSLRWFQGHFDGHPILPGVVQLHWAASLAEALFNRITTFSGVTQLKFHQLVVPDSRLQLALQYDPGKQSTAFSYTFSDGPEDKPANSVAIISEGRLRHA